MNNRIFSSDDLEKSYSLVHNFTESPADQQKAIEKGIVLLQDNQLHKKTMQQRNRLLEEKIDVTRFLVDFVEEYMEGKIR